MEIKKFEHACLVLTKEDQSLVIDPGVWSEDFVCPEHVMGIVITHEHPDHFDLSKLRTIVQTNPEVCIYAHVDTLAHLEELSSYGREVSSGQEATVGPFSLRFTGGIHATIHSDYPIPANLGVLVNDGEFYYPGDSFVLPDCPIKTLAVPASAPWMKMSEAMDFITAIKPEACFPTHNVLLSAEGQALANTWLTKAAEAINSDYAELPANKP